MESDTFLRSYLKKPATLPRLIPVKTSDLAPQNPHVTDESKGTSFQGERPKTRGNFTSPDERCWKLTLCAQCSNLFLLRRMGQTRGCETNLAYSVL